MRGVRNLLHILYNWLIVGFGFWLLAHTLPLLNLDYSRELLLLAALVILAEWLTVLLPQGQLSGGFAVVFAAFLIYGPVAAAWLVGLASLVGQGVVNRGNPLRVTMFNAAQYILALLGANYLYHLAGGSSERVLVLNNLPALAVFVLAYFGLNQLMVYLYGLPVRQSHPAFPWTDALRWDVLTYLATIPCGLLMALLFGKIGIYGMLLLFLPVLITQFMLRVYVNRELTNRSLRMLYEVAKRLGGRLKLDDLFALVLRETGRMINFHTGLIYLRSETDDDLYVVEAAVGFHAQLLSGSMVRRGEGFLGMTVEIGEPQVVHDSRSDSRITGDEGLTQVFRSILVAPMVAGAEVWGLLVLAEKLPDLFEDQHLQTISIVMGQTALAAANVQLHRKLEQAAITDGLTGLYNYRYFHRRLVAELDRANRYGYKLALLLLDIDFFKQINERYAHLGGDAVLGQVARLIAAELRDDDLAARYGGQEFAVLISEAGPGEALEVAERIRMAVRDALFEHEGEQFTVRVSAGVAIYPTNADNLQEFLAAAGGALSRAKEEGRNRSLLAE
ncbi:MAG: sensor domain-containing diguanylate cyclase [Firmicutes bacterium]|nr:sensor domain-containing diguanylate cyclase [Bacillota bacterium]